MPNKVIIFGSHPLVPQLVKQFEQAEAQVTVCQSLQIPTEATVPDELAVLSEDDAVTHSFLVDIATLWEGRSQERPLVHLLLKQTSSLHMYRKVDFPEVVNRVFEVYPFTMEEAWSNQVVVRLPGIIDHPYPALDRKPVLADSDQFVHLVIAGFDAYASGVAVKAAHVAHYPNYNGKQQRPLRTRISFISSRMGADRNAFIARFRTLFEHSFYRSIDLEAQTSQLHHPQYEGNREDFVDVEWEFIDGDLSHPILAQKLKLWALDPCRQLTLVLSDEQDSVNIERALSLPEEIYSQIIPVWVRQKKDMLTGVANRSPKYKNLISFGMEDCGYDVRLPAVRLSRLLHYCYSCISARKEIPTVFLPEEVDKKWREVNSLKTRMANVSSIETMATKMHSLGHDPEDARTFYALSQEEIDSLSRCEHNRWCVERLMAGMRPCTDEERERVGRDIAFKTVLKNELEAHYDLCAYDDLGMDENGVDVREYDRLLVASIPLMTATCLEEEKV